MLAFIKILNENKGNDFEKREKEDQILKLEMDDEKQLGIASILVDEGYGQFERCYNASRCLRGDIKKARELLSNIIFYGCNN